MREWQHQQKALQDEQTNPIVKFLHVARNARHYGARLSRLKGTVFDAGGPTSRSLSALDLARGNYSQRASNFERLQAANRNLQGYRVPQAANSNSFFQDLQAVANSNTGARAAAGNMSNAPRMSSGKGGGHNPTSVGSSSGTSAGSNAPASDRSMGRSTSTGKVESNNIGKGGTRPLEQVTPDYACPEAAYSLRIDPITGRGPMSVDARDFTYATSYTVEGAPRNMNQFWKLWAERYPETLSARNLEIIAAKKAPEVDAQWIQYFPEHQHYLGDTLIHHHIDHSNLTIGLPYELHARKPGRKIFHTNLGGTKKSD